MKLKYLVLCILVNYSVAFGNRCSKLSRIASDCLKKTLLEKPLGYSRRYPIHNRKLNNLQKIRISRINTTDDIEKQLNRSVVLQTCRSRTYLLIHGKIYYKYSGNSPTEKLFYYDGWYLLEERDGWPFLNLKRNSRD